MGTEPDEQVTDFPKEIPEPIAIEEEKEEDLEEVRDVVEERKSVKSLDPEEYWKVSFMVTLNINSKMLLFSFFGTEAELLEPREHLLWRGRRRFRPETQPAPETPEVMCDPCDPVHFMLTPCGFCDSHHAASISSSSYSLNLGKTVAWRLLGKCRADWLRVSGC